LVHHRFQLRHDFVGATIDVTKTNFMCRDFHHRRPVLTAAYALLRLITKISFPRTVPGLLQMASFALLMRSITGKLFIAAAFASQRAATVVAWDTHEQGEECHHAEVPGTVLERSW